jgi:hypothetical protein
VVRTANNYNYGAFYAQDILLESHAMGISADNLLIGEQTSGQIESIRPVQMLASADQQGTD